MAKMTDQEADAVLRQVLNAARGAGFGDADAIADAADRLHRAVQQQLVGNLLAPILKGFVQGGFDERNQKAFEIAKHGVGEQAR